MDNSQVIFFFLVTLFAFVLEFQIILNDGLEIPLYQNEEWIKKKIGFTPC